MPNISQLKKYFIDPSVDVLGIDVSDGEIRVVNLQRRRRGRVELTRYRTGSIPKSGLCNGQIGDIDVFQKSLRSVLEAKHNTFSTRTAFVAISDRHIFLKTIHLPVPSRDIRDAIPWEVSRHVPFDARELYLDWKIFSPNSQGVTPVLTIAAQQSMIDAYISALDRTGITLLSIEPASLALCRSVARQLPDRGCTMLVSVGAQESISVVVCNRIPILSSSLPFTFTMVLNTLSKQFNLDNADALRSLRLLGFHKLRARGVIRDFLMAQLLPMIEHIKELEEYVIDHIPDAQPISSVLVSGYGAAIAGLTDELALRLKKQVQNTALPQEILNRESSSINNEYQAYMVAVGSALRSIETAQYV